MSKQYLYVKFNKMKKFICLSISIFLFFSCGSQKITDEGFFKTVFETSEGRETATYFETMSFYERLAGAYASINIYEMGQTDSGQPLHLVVFDADGNSETAFSRNANKNYLLINNGIHPGEPDGIDASMLLLRNLAQNKIKPPKNTVIAVIPIYNIGGALNRNSTSRINQNGPVEYGFRGNARNLDLNRDFIKADSKNARAFAEIFHQVKPDLFIDNHVSNGADYQYVLTHLFTQHNKLRNGLGEYLHRSFMPRLEDSLAQKSWDITPYVNVFNQTPEGGFSQFFDSPRYSTGYAALFNTLGMMVETHMLKPYKQRVEGTYELMKTFIEIADGDAEKIKMLRDQAKKIVRKEYTIGWEIDSSKTSTLNFKGYEGTMIPSNITGDERLKYDRDKPFTKKIVYYNHFKPTKTISLPEKYIIPQGWWNVMELLKLNNIKFSEIKKDTLMEVQVYRIKSFETVASPYEGHYLHYNTQTETVTEKVLVNKGDFVIDTKQEGVRYLVETLEPSAVDSFFNWNFFDTILQQKEHFSPYVWEDIAEKFLNENPEIKLRFETKKKAEPDFAKNWYAQLDWIHKQSPYYETSNLRYPIVRVGG